MKPLEQLKKCLYSGIQEEGEDGFWGIYKTGGKVFYFIFSFGGDWEHLSISVAHEKRVPSWQEMCMFKDIFWLPEEWVVQYHPARSDYVNNHPGVLHLWRPTKEKLPMPPKIFV